jgi:hypothetical protein
MLAILSDPLQRSVLAFKAKHAIHFPAALEDTDRMPLADSVVLHDELIDLAS